jgi:hypothetical protein
MMSRKNDDLREVPLVIVIKDGVVDQAIQCRDSAQADQVFLSLCKPYASNPEDLEAHLEDGYLAFMNGSICRCDSMEPDEIEQ